MAHIKLSFQRSPRWWQSCFIHRCNSTVCTANAILLQKGKKKDSGYVLPLQPTNNKYIGCQISHTFAINQVQWKASANIHFFNLCDQLRGFLAKPILSTATVFNGERLWFFIFFFIVDIQQPPFPSKYTKPTLPTLTHTRPRFLHRVVSMPRRRLGSPPVGCGPSCGSGTLTVGLVSEMNGHLLVGPRLLRGRFVFVNNIIVVSLVAIERHWND